MERSYRRSSRRALVEEGFQAGVAGAADRQARAVGENRQAAVLAIGFDANDALEIHDVRAVDTYETVRVEASFESGDGLLLEMLFALSGERHIIVLSLRIVELA